MRISLFAPVLAIAFFASGAHAQIFKCTGPGGTMELSDRPCAKGKSSVINVGPTNVLDGSHNRRLAAQQRQERAAEAARERFDALVAAEQRQQEDEAESDRIHRQKLYEANAKAQDEARRRARRKADADVAEARQRAAMQSSETRPASCDSGGCWGWDGSRYNRSGSGGTYFRQDGRACRSIGGQLQCN